MGIYIFCFLLCILGCYCYDRRFKGIMGADNAPYIKKTRFTAYFFLTLTFLPIILLYGLRFDVGTDYAGYVEIYKISRTASFSEYLNGFRDGSPFYYFEPGYYLINKVGGYLFDNEHSAFLLTGLLVFFLLNRTFTVYKNQISFGMAIYIYLMTQFMYALNGVRFAIASIIILYGYKYIIASKPFRYLACVIVACLFHKTAMLCIVFYFLKDFSNYKFNFIRNILFYLCIIFTPVLSKIGLLFAKSIPAFSRYFMVYNLDTSQGSLVYLWRILPTLLPLMLLAYIYRKSLSGQSVLIRILMCRIALLYLGYYYVYLSRLDRFSWVTEIILVPLFLKKISNTAQRRLLTLYFLLWYFFVFFVYYVVQSTDLFPYQSIF